MGSNEINIFVLFNNINYIVKKAVAAGIDPIKAIKMGSTNAAKHYGLRRLGAVAPGYQADLVVFEDLKDFEPRMVYAKGQRGRRLGQVDERTFKKAEEMLHGELAAALDIPPDQVKDYICRRVEALEKT